jgi:dTDP-4-amino-4,6-dideoxygalactose transaminase
VCKEHGLALIEDAAQAHGAEYHGRKVGTLGELACYSFYPTKNLGSCGEGGAVASADPALAAKIRFLRDHAQEPRGVHQELGFNHRMTGFQGATLGVKLPHLAEWIARRRAVARMYLDGLADAPGLTLPVEAEGRLHAWHQFVVRHPERDRLRAALGERGVGTGIYYLHPVHRQPAYAHLGYAEGSLPQAEAAAREVFALPMFPELTDAEVAHVIASVREVLA